MNVLSGQQKTNEIVKIREGTNRMERNQAFKLKIEFQDDVLCCNISKLILDIIFVSIEANDSPRQMNSNF